MCAFLTRDNSKGEAQIVSYVVSGVGFLGAGVIFKDSGTVRGLNTAATVWCSAAIGAICGLGYLPYGASVAGVVLLTNLVVRPLSYRLYPTQQVGPEQEIVYTFELVCRAEDEAHIRALVTQEIARSSLTLSALKSEDIEGTPKLKVAAQIRGFGRQDALLEQLIARLSLEGGVTSASWAVSAQIME
jgi:putative Mg2+ transporter-C (MgtC) family protein